MGVDYSTILAVGKSFESMDDAVSYYLSKVDSPESDIEEIEDNLVEYLECKEGYPTADYINHYSGGYGVYIGFGIYTSGSVSDLVKSLNESVEVWVKLFGDQPEIIDEVMVW